MWKIFIFTLHEEKGILKLNLKATHNKDYSVVLSQCVRGRKTSPFFLPLRLVNFGVSRVPSDESEKRLFRKFFVD